MHRNESISRIQFLVTRAHASTSLAFSAKSCARALGANGRIGIGVIAVWWLMISAPLMAASLEAGVSVVDTTPPIPFRMSGYFEERLSTGIKDPLHVKAIVFRQGDELAALVLCDLLGVPLEVSGLARSEAAKKANIPAENIVVAATHSHTGPLYFDSLRNFLHERSIERLGRDPYETIDYPSELVEHIVAAIVEAKSKLQPVELTTFTAEERRLSFNRRFHMKDGSVQFNLGQLNPEIVRPAGPIDPDVGTILLTRQGASVPLAAIVSFALHLDTVNGTEYSADYPKHCEDKLRQVFGSHFTLLFGAGTCGDINHADVTTRGMRTSSEIGRMLAGTILGAFEKSNRTSSSEPTLAVKSVKVEVPLQRYSASEVASARRKMALIGTRQLPFLEEVEAYKITDLQLRRDDKVSMEVQVFRLTRDAAIVALPGEVFVELGLAIKKASPFNTTLVIELANDYPAYIPTKKAFAEGSYEIVNSRVQPGAGEQLVDAAIKLVKELE